MFLATYSHIDAAWRWPLQEGLQQAQATFRSILKVLGAFPQLKFSETSGSYYAWMRRTDPDAFAQLASMVAQRRWEPVGGWWTEADVNVISGESLMRQALVGQREFQDHLGVTTLVSFLPDSFGSSANLPAILRAQGFRYHVLGRGTFDGSPLPAGAFVWDSLGDASIIAYNNPVSGGSNDAVATVQAAAKERDGLLVWFGLGDHGGGPTIESLTALMQFLQSTTAPRVEFTFVQSYLAALPRSRIAKKGEIEGVFPGAYTNAYELKRSMIDAERALVDCERYDVLAMLCGVTAAPPELDDLWKIVLLNQHHDTISATGPRANIRSAIAGNQSVSELASLNALPYLASIADRIAHSPSDDAMLVVFNPLPHARRELVRYPLSVSSGQVPAIFDATGAAVAAQICTSSDPYYEGVSPQTCFNAELPAFGYAAYRVAGSHAAAKALTDVKALRTTTLTVAIDERTGLPSQLEDSQGTLSLGRMLFPVFQDTEDTWGSNGLSTAQTFGTFDAHAARIVESGPVRTIMQGSFTFRNSRLDVQTEIREGERAIRFTIDMDWAEPFMRFGLAFNLRGTSALYDIPFGVVERAPSAQIQPGIAFVARSRAPHGLVGLVTCGNHGFWASPDDMGVTLARSTPYSDLGSVDQASQHLQEIGRRQVRVMLALCDDLVALRDVADGFERTFPVLWNGVHDGTAPERASFASVNGGVTVPSLRRVDETFEARLHNLGASRTLASGFIGHAALHEPIDAFGIRTLRLRDDRFEDITPP